MEFKVKTEQELKEFFKELTFDEPSHTYHVGTQKVKKSVSGLLKKYYKEFDASGIAPFVAKKRGCSTEDILEEWKQSGLTATTLGTAVHAFGEHYMTDRDLTPQNIQEEAIKEWVDKIPNHLLRVGEEVRMWNKTGTLFAGTCDGILFNSLTGKYILYDFKTNKTLDKVHRNTKMLAPFNHLLDCSYNKYQLQLGFYKMLLEQVPGVEVESMIILHLPHEGGYQMRYVDDYSAQLKELV